LKRPNPNSYWVEPGRLLAGEHPSAEGESALPKRLRRLLDAGIDCFIDLTKPGECADYRPLLPETVTCARVPMLDHGVPEDPALLRQALAALGEALAEGRRVYVHCRAGIGRTGMVIGTYLIEAGERPDAALETLNTLWQQDARFPRWPRVPETEAQERYILQWRAQGAAAALFDDRAAGALLGLAVGDAQAASARGEGPGIWTDDTAMVLCVAASFASCRGFDARDQLEQYRRWMRDGQYSATGAPLGMRPAVRRAIAMAGWRRGLVMGSHDPAVVEPEALGRCIVPALFHHREFAAAVAAGAETARVTHQTPLVVDACRLFTGLLQRVLSGEGKRVALGALARMPGPPLKPEVQTMLLAWSGGTPGPEWKPGTVLAVLDAVVRVFLAHDDFASGLQAVLARGGETDVACAAYGQLAGALYGAEGIPRILRDALVAPEKIRNAVGMLNAASGP
jgi:ADP-ribosylglycohydrolase